MGVVEPVAVPVDRGGEVHDREAVFVVELVQQILRALRLFHAAPHQPDVQHEPCRAIFALDFVRGEISMRSHPASDWAGASGR